MEKLLEEFSLGLFVWQTLLFVGLLLLLKICLGPNSQRCE
jgi:F-type H+-transporting ATPase subunit b